MIARLFGRRPVRAAAPAPEVPLTPGEVHAAISVASVNLDQAGHTLTDAHAALDAYWDTLDPADLQAAHQAGSDLIRAVGRYQSALARTRRGGAS
ncbi:hypothetical protein [Streptomonospora arabica]|uniref:Uncharacterized protein n=1 Tax=Streptomonospora arabica TaxID=412417 RepID=A0ABV9SSH4_9ACTN